MSSDLERYETIGAQRRTSPAFAVPATVEELRRENADLRARAEAAERERDEANEARRLTWIHEQGTEEFYRGEFDRAIAARNSARAEADALRAALAELVALKDLKERIETLEDVVKRCRDIRSEAELTVAREQYEQRKPAAWAAARALVAAAAPTAGEEGAEP